MRNTGVVRKIDELGRIVIPKEIRRTLGIKDGEEIEIFIDEENIILKKHHRLLGFKEVALKYVSLFNKLVNINLFITDRDKILVTNKNEYKELEDYNISSVLSKIIEERKETIGVNLNIGLDKTLKGYYYVKPLVIDADLIGSIICVSQGEINNQDKLIVDVIYSLLKIRIETD